MSDADELSRVRRRASRILDRVAAVLPTVRARLFALVLVALVRALVILVYDQWLARERGFAALTDLSTRVVRLLQREMDDRITRGAHRLAVLAADVDVVARSPAATRKLVDALREDRLYNNLLIADGTTGDCGRAPYRSIARPACATCSHSSAPGARSTSRPGPSSRTGHSRTGSQPRTTRRERGRHSDVRGVREH